MVQELTPCAASWSGLYGFPTAAGEVEARFTYVLVKAETEAGTGQWKIATHHSSLPPAQA